MRLVYIIFPVSTYILILSIIHPENVRGRLGQAMDDAGRFSHYLIVVSVVVVTGYFFVKQIIVDWRALRRR